MYRVLGGQSQLNVIVQNAALRNDNGKLISCRDRIEENMRPPRGVERTSLRCRDTRAHILSVDVQSFPLCAHISRRAPPVVHRVRVGCVVGDSVGGAGADETPTGTYFTNVSEDHIDDRISSLHPIGFSRENFDNQLLLCVTPCSHFSIRVNHELDVFRDVLHLSALAMQGNG